MGDPADVIIRRFLYLCCEENDFLDESMEAEELLWMILINMVPKSIIEQKNGNDKVIIDETLLAKEREYYLLFEQLGNAKRNLLVTIFINKLQIVFWKLKVFGGASSKL